MEKKFKIWTHRYEKIENREIDESKDIFARCMACTRTYKRTEKYPYETCRACEVEGIKLEEVIKE